MIGEKVSFTTSDGLKIAGILDFPDNPGSFPLALVLHGFGGTREDSEVWSDILNPLGIGTLRIDFRGTGESEGKYQEKTLSGFVKDAQAALEYVYKLEKADKKKIAIVGHSMGGTTAILLSSKEPRIKTLVVTSPAVKPAKTIADLYDQEDFSKGAEKGSVELRTDGERKLLNYSFFEDAKTHDVFKEAQQIPYPFLIITGEKDDVVMFEDLKKFSSAVKNARIVNLPYSGHNLGEEWVTAEKAITQWFTEWLQS